MSWRTVVRGVFLTVVLLSLVTLAVGWATAPSHAPSPGLDQSGTPTAEGDQIASGRGAVTVVTTDPPGDTGGTAALIALTADGRTLYRHDSYGNYFDVDPDPPGSRTVLYVAGSRYEPCPAILAARSSETFEDGCANVVIERVNLSTGDTERVHSAVTAWDIWHDVDRVDDDRFLVADLASDRVVILNTTTDAIEWEWRAEDDLDPESGGRPDDWTHINDVELLDDGRVMASLRNQDRVVFLDPDVGLQENRTLGAENTYSILYEQHNPDYIPPERGGPAVVVADSENNRVVEYRYAGSRWRRVWTWSDDRLRWPRDADRLPGGHTLVTDSQGDRVLELDEHDEVIWHLDVATPYEAERLGTGDESATGWSTTALSNGSRVSTSADPADRTDRTTGLAWVVAFVTGPGINGLLYAAPSWVRFRDLVVAIVLAWTALTWLALEAYWSRARRRSLE